MPSPNLRPTPGSEASRLNLDISPPTNSYAQWIVAVSLLTLGLLALLMAGTCGWMWHAEEHRPPGPPLYYGLPETLTPAWLVVAGLFLAAGLGLFVAAARPKPAIVPRLVLAALFLGSAGLSAMRLDSDRAAHTLSRAFGWIAVASGSVLALGIVAASRSRRHAGSESTAASEVTPPNSSGHLTPHSTPHSTDPGSKSD